MACNICEQDPCACQRVVTPIQRSTFRPIPHGITKEEFGLDLYDTIKTIGALLGLHESVAHAVRRGEGWRVQDLKTRIDIQRKELAILLPKLKEKELKDVLDRYPNMNQL